MSLTPHERVMRSLNFEPVDRLAVFDSFWGEFVPRWRRFLNLDDDANPTDYYEIDLEICIADETPWPSRAGVIEDRGDEVIQRDGWGRVVRRLKNGYFSENLEVAVPRKTDLDRLEFEDPAADARYEGFLKQVARHRPRRAPFCKIGGPFLRTCFLRGEVDFLMDIAGDPVFARELAEKVADHIMHVALESLRRGDLYDTGVWMFDDMAYNDNPMFSPDQFERIFLPSYRKLVAAFKRAGAAKVVVEDFLDHPPGVFGVGEEVAQVEDAGVVTAPEPVGAAKGRDAAFHRDTCAGEGDGPAGAAEGFGGALDGLLVHAHGRRKVSVHPPQKR